MFQPMSEQELYAVQTELQRLLLPAVLKSTMANANLLIASLKNQNKAISAANLLQTALALKGSIDWEVAPGRSAREQRDAANALGLGHNRTELDRPELNKPQISVYDMQKQVAETARRNKALVETESIINGHHGRTHARTQVERSQLRAQRDRLVAAKADPEVIKASIEKAARQIQPSSLGS